MKLLIEIPSADYRSIRRSWLRPLCLAVMAVIGLTNLCGAAETNRAPAGVIFPKSVFIDDPNGKDPFFPNRQRGVVPKPAPGPVAAEPNWKALQLRGITGVGDQRYALINNLPFAKGEEGEVKVPAGKRGETAKIKIKILEVKEKSVIIQVEGQSDQKELLLTERLIPFQE